MTSVHSTMVLNKCGSTPGTCGCSACSVYALRPFAKKVLGVIYNGTHQPFLGWMWKDDTVKEMTKAMSAAKAEMDRCEKTEGYCGCSDCNRYQVLAQQKGSEFDFVERFKVMNLDVPYTSFRWNYAAADYALKF
jgi:hypothetical protein